MAKKILLIDDEESLLDNIGSFLEMKGFEVLKAQDGKTGVDIVKAESPDLVLLDLHLKEGPTGVQILRVIKMIKPDTKVIILTGFGEEEDAKSKCLELGASDFMSKPASLKMLSTQIDKLLGETKQ